MDTMNSNVEEKKRQFVNTALERMRELAKNHNSLTTDGAKFLFSYETRTLAKSKLLVDKLREHFKIRNYEDALKIVEKNGLALQYIVEDLKDVNSDKYIEIIITAVKENSDALEFVPSELQDKNSDKYLEIVNIAVESDGDTLKWVSDRFKNDDEIAKKAIENDPTALQYVSEEFIKNNPNIEKSSIIKLKTLIIKDVKNIAWIPEKILFRYPQLVYIALKENGECLNYIKEEFWQSISSNYTKTEYIELAVFEKILGIRKYFEKTNKKRIPLFKQNDIIKKYLSTFSNDILEEISNKLFTYGLVGCLPEDIIIKHKELITSNNINNISIETLIKIPDILIKCIKEQPFIFWKNEYYKNDIIPAELKLELKELAIEKLKDYVRKSESNIKNVNINQMPKEDYYEIAMEAMRYQKDSMYYIPDKFFLENPYRIQLEAKIFRIKNKFLKLFSKKKENGELKEKIKEKAKGVFKI